jgi:excisionase family DNA binding protein
LKTFGGEEYMTIAEAANLLHISEWTIRGWVATEKISYTRERGRVYILASIIRWLLEGVPPERDKVPRGRPSLLHRRDGTPKPGEVAEGPRDSGGIATIPDPDVQGETDP